MGHYAKVVDGIVQTIIVADQDYMDNLLDDSAGAWIKTSYNTRGGVHYKPNSNEKSDTQEKSLRKNFGVPGSIYDSAKDAFYEPQPYPSWVLDEDTCWWKAPVERPNKPVKWNEETKSWDDE